MFIDWCCHRNLEPSLRRGREQSSSNLVCLPCLETNYTGVSRMVVLVSIKFLFITESNNPLFPSIIQSIFEDDIWKLFWNGRNCSKQTIIIPACVPNCFNAFPHTTILQQTTLNVFCQNIENLHNWMENLWQKVETLWQKEKLRVELLFKII